MQNAIKLFGTVALLEDMPEKGLLRGQVGYVIEIHTPDVFEVEFSDPSGITYAMLAIPGDKLMLLRYEPAVKNP